MPSILRSITGYLLDVFFPRSCVHCGDAVEYSDYKFICQACSRELIISKPPTCTTCGYPFLGMLAGPKTCPHCCELSPIFSQGKTLFLAKGPGRSLIHELKYKSGFYVLRDIEAILKLVPFCRAYFKGAVLVPVPLNLVKLRERGFNQSERIAEALSQATDAKSCKNLLVRTANTPSQTSLRLSNRRQNVKNAFALAKDAVVIPDETYILIDDVFTTGSTLNACAAVLHEAGAFQLKVATLGHG